MGRDGVRPRDEVDAMTSSVPRLVKTTAVLT
jgi:hypothetical protein